MNYYVGLDVSLRSVAVCMIDANGKHVFERSVACEIDDISHCLADFSASELRIGFEAGAMSQHLFFGLRAAGFDVVCMEARQVNATLSAMRNKTDETDAPGIANVLRSGWFIPVHMKSREAHTVHALLSSRKAAQRKCIDLANEIRGYRISMNVCERVGPTVTRTPIPPASRSTARSVGLLWSEPRESSESRVVC